MRYILFVLAFLLCINSVQAGNKLDPSTFTIDSNGFNAGYRSEYSITENMHLMFDKDYPADLAEYVISEVNRELTDIQITYSFSDVDYDHSSELFQLSPEKYNKQFAPNRIFLHLGRGWAQGGFAANLRVFETGEPTCFIRHRKDQYFTPGIEFVTQANITIHEIYHCLAWDHAENNPYVGGFDFQNKDNTEVLHRLYDKNNSRGDADVFIDGIEGSIGFIANEKVRENSVYTSGVEVRIIPGKYVIQIDDKYRCKGKNKLCGKLKKGKKFKFKEGCKYAVYTNSKGIVKVQELD